MKKKSRRALFYLTVALFLVLGTGAALYPVLSNYYIERHASAVYTEYQETVAQTESEELEKALEDAKAYNDKLKLGGGLPEGYDTLLNLAGDGIMGYVVIPSLSLKVPIRHGVDPETLEVGAGHLVGSSLPVGGEGTHAVITAHSGMPGQKMFSDLDRLVEGDVFYLEILGERLTYRVDRILTVLPEQTNALAAEPGKDLCTLVTCTPFGVNTHRLLVRGERTSNEEDPAVHGGEISTETHESTWEKQYRRYLILGFSLFAGIILIALFVSAGKRIYQKQKERKKAA